MPQRKDKSELVHHQLPDGRIATSYLVDGVPSRLVEITRPAAERAAAEQLKVKELEACERYITLLIKKLELLDGIPPEKLEEESTTIQSLYAAAVITYGKVIPGLYKEDNVFKGEGKKYQEFHDWLIKNHRHDYVAHANNGHFQDAKTYLVLTQNGTEISMLAIPHATYQPHMSLTEAKDFSRLVLHVKSHGQKRVQKALSRVINVELESFGIYRVPISLVYETAEEYFIRPEYPPGPLIRD